MVQPFVPKEQLHYETLPIFRTSPLKDSYRHNNFKTITPGPAERISIQKAAVPEAKRDQFLVKKFGIKINFEAGRLEGTLELHAIVVKVSSISVIIIWISPYSLKVKKVAEACIRIADWKIIVYPGLIHIIEIFGRVAAGKWEIVWKVDHIAPVLLLVREVEYRVMVN